MVGKFLAAAIVVTSLTSCYSTTTCVGTLPADAPMVKVNSTKNHFLIYGLVPISNTKIEDSKYVGKSKYNRENETDNIVKTKRTSFEFFSS